MTDLNEFIGALGADVVIDLVDEGVVTHPGPYSVVEMMAITRWYDQRQRALREDHAGPRKD